MIGLPPIDPHESGWLPSSGTWRTVVGTEATDADWIQAGVVHIVWVWVCVYKLVCACVWVCVCVWVCAGACVRMMWERMCVQLSLSMLRVSVRVCNVHSTTTVPWAASWVGAAAAVQPPSPFLLWRLLGLRRQMQNGFRLVLCTLCVRVWVLVCQWLCVWVSECVYECVWVRVYGWREGVRKNMCVCHCCGWAYVCASQCAQHYHCTLTWFPPLTVSGQPLEISPCDFSFWTLWFLVCLSRRLELFFSQIQKHNTCICYPVHLWSFSAWKKELKI